LDQQPVPAPATQPSCRERIEQVLADARKPLTLKNIRAIVRMRSKRSC
jgi:predicted Zn-ribbon and HTH transcriptional regulator